MSNNELVWVCGIHLFLPLFASFLCFFLQSIRYSVWVILSAASLIVVIRALLTQILVYSSFGIWPYAFEDLIDNTSSNYRLFEHFATIPIIILAIFTETKRCRRAIEWKSPTALVLLLIILCFFSPSVALPFFLKDHASEMSVFHRVFDHQYFRRLYMLLSMLMLGMASLQFYSLVEEWEGVTVSGVYNLGVGLWIHETLCQHLLILHFFLWISSILWIASASSIYVTCCFAVGASFHLPFTLATYLFLREHDSNLKNDQ